MKNKRILSFLVLIMLAAVPGTMMAQGLSDMELLGKLIFFDKRLSTPSGQACADCHGPNAGWVGDNPGINAAGAVYPGAVQQRFGDRKPPSSAYATISPVFHYDPVEGLFIGGNFWDGRATGERLGNPAADQALGPFLNPVEQNNPSKEVVCDKIASGSYSPLFETVWGPGSLDCTYPAVELTYDQIALSIAAYEDSSEVNQFNSRFDDYLNACVAAGNHPDLCGLGEAGQKTILDPTSILTQQEFDGLIEFGEYCSPCHISTPGPNGEPAFTDFTYDNIGVPINPENPIYDVDPLFVDIGLAGFLQTRPEWAMYVQENLGKQKVPTVRNADLRPGPGFTKAYMHNGVFKSLKQVVHFYNTRDVPSEMWPPPEVDVNVNREIFEGVPLGDLQLSDAAEDATVAFLGTLSDRGRVCQGEKHAKIRGGGQKASTTDLQMQLELTVMNDGCIIDSKVKSITVTAGTVLGIDWTIGSGPPPTEVKLDGAVVPMNDVFILTVDAQKKLDLTNKGSGGKDTDQITIDVVP